MKKTIVLLVVFLNTITLYSQEDKSKIEILEEAVKISSVNNVDIKTGGNGKVYYNSKEIATIDQLSNIDISNLEDLKMKDRSSGAPIVLTDFLEILGTNSSWKAFVGSSVTNKPVGLPTGTYRIVSFGSNGQNSTQQQGVAIAFKGSNGDAYLISRDETSTLKAQQIVINGETFTPVVITAPQIQFHSMDALEISVQDIMNINAHELFFNGKQVATVDQTQKLVNYSTSEQKTGQKWVDGKDVYQRTLMGAITQWDNQHFVVPFTKTNTGLIVKFESFIHNQDQVIPLNSFNNNKFWGNDSEIGRYSCWYDKYGNTTEDGVSGFDIKDIDNLNEFGYSYIIHVYYTK